MHVQYNDIPLVLSHMTYIALDDTVNTELEILVPSANREIWLLSHRGLFTNDVMSEGTRQQVILHDKMGMGGLYLKYIFFFLPFWFSVNSSVNLRRKKRLIQKIT